jgi:hypothetical protein
LPGAACFVLTSSYPNPPQLREAWVAPNSSYAISGLTFVSGEPKARAEAWRALLAPGVETTPIAGGFALPLAPHRLRWLTPAAYQAQFGQPWQPAPHPLGELALVHLLAEDLGRFESCLEAANRRVLRLADELLVPAGLHDGFASLVTQRPAAPWLAERMVLSGERLELHRVATTNRVEPDSYACWQGREAWQGDQR